MGGVGRAGPVSALDYRMFSVHVFFLSTILRYVVEWDALVILIVLQLLVGFK